MSNEVKLELATSKARASLVRFSESEYRVIVRDTIDSGKSIPALLRMAYFKKGITAPSLDVEIRNTVVRELAQIGNNLNQLFKVIHAQGVEGVKAELLEALNDIRILKSYLGLKYGHR